jgi:hypothetical protein
MPYEEEDTCLRRGLLGPNSQEPQRAAEGAYNAEKDVGSLVARVAKALPTIDKN